MAIPEYLSPSAISLFYQNLAEYYMKYLSGDKPPRFPQTQPMGVGSAFDAYAKNFLHTALFGKDHDPRFDLKTIFEVQVEEQNRDFCWTAGAHCFDEYKKSGALSDLLIELQGSITDPKFEIEVKGVVNGQREGVTLNVQDIPLLGKPDVFYINKAGAHVILDWKVNGYCSKYPVSPMKGYVRLRKDGINQGQHKEAQIMSHCGVMINATCGLEDLNKDWARQLCIYAWLCGMEIGSDFIIAVDQLVCKPHWNKPEIRVAEHRLRTRTDSQWKIYVEIQHVWETVNSVHIFKDVTLEESQAKCKYLDQCVQELRGNGTPEDQWFASVTRQM